MRRILLVTPSLALAGGAEKLVNSVAELLRDTYQISVASFDSPDTEPFFVGKVPYYALGGGGRRVWWQRLSDYWIAASRLRELKKRLDCDLAISILWRADLMNAFSQRRDRIVSLTVINLVNNPSNITLVRMRWLVGLVYRRFDRVLAISPDIAAEYRSLYRLSAIRLGVFKTFLAPVRPSAVHPGKPPRFVFCARAVYEKNLDGLLEVFACYSSRRPGRQLVVIGDGPLLPEMKSLAGQLGLSTSTQPDASAQVLFVGNTAKPEDYMAGALAFLLTSRHEGVPTVAILAASLGLPLLAADCEGGGMRLLFDLPTDAPIPQAGDPDMPAAGLLLPIPEPTRLETINAWLSAMEAVDLDPQLRRRWSAGARELAAARSPEAVRQEWITTIDSVLAR